jgi:hypothetical protein
MISLVEIHDNWIGLWYDIGSIIVDNLRPPSIGKTPWYDPGNEKTIKFGF